LLRFVFGPVRSRRLGLSLGVNNIPYKTCSYSCIYCQLDRTLNLTAGRGEFFDWRDIVGEVVEYFRGLGGGVDYITFVADGEPLLDKSIGRESEWIKRETSTPIAVLTNASLLYLDEARSDLREADLVSLKVDAVSEDVWRTVNRPYPTLKLGRILERIVEFARGFKGTIITETMLVRRFNDGGVEFEKIAEFLRELSPRNAYIAISVRPPAESFVLPPGRAGWLKHMRYSREG
jgi:wyosine [tRNA(Phe)-imidazoG37] synthetase (radical SAM superfamily)